MTLVLASGSPRRRLFLEELGYTFVVHPADIDESQTSDEAPLTYARRLARTKAAVVAARQMGAVVLAADTIVVAGGGVLGKPGGERDFQRMMLCLSGREHDVITAVAVHAGGAEEVLSVTTRVTFRALSPGEIDWYWQSGEPRDKAGGYALQGRGGAFITAIEGSHSNVIGLPLVETVELLERAGISPPWRGA